MREEIYMKARTVKKLLCVLMSAVLLVSCVLPAVAANRKCLKDDVPLLVVSGFSEYVLVDKTTGKAVWPPDRELIMNAVQKALPAVETLIASNRTQRDYDKFCDVVIPALNELFSYIKCTPDGEPYNKNVGLLNQFTGPVSDYDFEEVRSVFTNDIVDIAVNTVGADHTWVYGLDWRVDPMVIADEIHEYVENMKERTGHKKVAIAGISMGGCIVSAYLAKYGYEDLSNITMLSSAFTGLELVGSLFCGEVVIDEQGLYNMINESMGNSIVSDILSSTGLLKKVLPFADELIEYEKDRIFSECLIPGFGYTTGIWTFLPESRYDEARQYMSMRMNDGTPEQAKAFWEKIDNYHDNVSVKIKDILKNAKKDGVCVSVVSNYDSQMPPVSSASNLTGDQVIETVHTSGYATVAPYGQTLGSAYPRNEHLSFDRMIDASTCYFPDNTWFIKYQNHVEFSNQGANDNSRFFAWIMVAPADADIHSKPEFPQFMTYDSENHVLSPLSAMMGDVNSNGFVSIADAKLALQGIVGLKKLTSAEKWTADMNYDDKISITDAKAILKTIVG